MNLSQGEKLLEVMVANSAFGELIPGPMGLEQLELAVKQTLNGSVEAEMRIGYRKGSVAYLFPELDESGVERVKSMLRAYARSANQPGIFRNYEFSDCRSDQEMRFRILLIPEYRAVKMLPKEKVVPFKEIEKICRCPVCEIIVPRSSAKCPECGALIYKENGRRYIESQGASFFPLRRDGAQEATLHLCKVDYVHAQRDVLTTHITYVEELPVYLGAVYTYIPPTKPGTFWAILNIPVELDLPGDFLPPQYEARRVDPAELKLLNYRGVRLFCGSGTEPSLAVLFRVWDYTNMDEIGNHVNFILMKYNDRIQELQNLPVLH